MADLSTADHSPPFTVIEEKEKAASRERSDITAASTVTTSAATAAATDAAATAAEIDAAATAAEIEIQRQERHDAMRVKHFDELLSFAHYTVYMQGRVGKETIDVVEEELLETAHFMLNNAAYDPYKQSLLAIVLIEAEGPQAVEMITTVLLPLERAYAASFGTIFEEKTGLSFWAHDEVGSAAGGQEQQEPMTRTARTRPHSLAILRVMILLAKEAGQGNENKLRNLG